LEFCAAQFWADFGGFPDSCARLSKRKFWLGESGFFLAAAVTGTSGKVRAAFQQIGSVGQLAPAAA